MVSIVYQITAIVLKVKQSCPDVSPEQYKKMILEQMMLQGMTKQEYHEYLSMIEYLVEEKEEKYEKSTSRVASHQNQIEPCEEREA